MVDLSMLKYLKILAEAEAEAVEDVIEVEVAEDAIPGTMIAIKEEEGTEAHPKEVRPVVQEKEELREKAISFS